MTGAPAWHQALAYAVTGERFEELGHQATPDLDAVVAFLLPRLGAGIDPTTLTRHHPLPSGLAEGLGPAQLGAAVSELRRRLGAGPALRVVTRERPLTADERRLAAEVPPHHGS